MRKLPEDRVYGFVSVYKIKLDRNLKLHHFPDANRDWLHFVAANRKHGLFLDELREFNELDIKGLKEVTSLNNVKGSFINIPYTLSNGEVIKLWDDNKIYLANQIKKQDSDRFYGLAADEEYLAVCEYGSMGEDAKIIIFKRYKNI